MASATLLIAVEGAQQARRAFDGLRGEARRAQQGMAADARAASQQRARAEADEVRTAQRQYRELQQARQRAAREATQAALRAARERVAAEQKALRDIDKATRDAQRMAAQAEREKTRTARTEANERRRIEAEEVRDAQRNARSIFLARRNAEREATAAAEREGRRRGQLADRARAYGRQVLGAAWGAAQNVHGQIQDVRQRNAASETNMNTLFLQTGADRGEAAAGRAAIANFARSHHMNLEAVIDAVAAPQSRFNALGGNTAQDRARALQATLADVDFANVIDPNNLGGIPLFGAMLRQQGVGETMRHDILRNVTGISFAGSVETEDAIRQGLPGMLRSLSTTLAQSPAGNRDEIIRTAVADYMAQVQTTAASGGAVGASGNRMNILRSALGSTDTQNRIGSALARRQMTDEERAEFGAAFTRGRDGRYTLGASYVNSPSNTARLFGHLFNNDPTAVANFLRNNGHHQFLNRPQADLITSYFASGQNAAGQTQRQYDLVSGLAAQTITPEREREMRETRNAEDRVNLADNENEHRASLGDNTSALNRLSNTINDWLTRNPIGAAVVGAVPGLVPGGTSGGPGGGSGAGGTALAAAGGVVSRIGGPLVAPVAAAAAPYVAGVTAALGYGLALGTAGTHVIDAAAGLAGHRTTEQQFGAGNRPSVFSLNTLSEAGRGVAGLFGGERVQDNRTTPPGGGEFRAWLREIRDAVREGASQATVTVNPTDAAHAAAALPGGNPRPFGA